MKINFNSSLLSLATITLLTFSGCGSDSSNNNSVDSYVGNANEVSNDVIAKQRAVLATSIVGKDVGAQAPRDIDSVAGANNKTATTAPAATAMNLCNIHFHKSAEHKGGEFTKYAGNGDGYGYETGYKYTGILTASESSSFEGGEVCTSDNGSLHSGDTIEVHYVYSSDDVQPGATLGACLAADRTDGTQPALRVEAQVYVLVNDEQALNFETLTEITHNGFYQAPNIPKNIGTAIQYEGSTTGPGYNEKISPFQVTWNVSPKVAKVSIKTVGEWCHNNNFDEHHAHPVRNLVINPNLLSEIK